MSEKISRLIAKEFVVDEQDMEPGRRMEPGDLYTYFVDPETGRFYRPRDGFEVVANENTDLRNLFIEVESIEVESGGNDETNS